MQRGAQKILRAYSNRTLAQRRVEYIQAAFPPHAHVPTRQREPVMVISSNTRGMHLVLNWACGCERKVRGRDPGNHGLGRTEGYTHTPGECEGVVHR